MLNVMWVKSCWFQRDLTHASIIPTWLKSRWKTNKVPQSRWNKNTVPRAQEFSGKPNLDVIRYLTLTFNKKAWWSRQGIMYKSGNLHSYLFWINAFAMKPHSSDKKKCELLKFKEGKKYYDKVGKAWKLGYLLYGPPETENRHSF